ncbi:MAG TPA: acyltransferase domain-containing protein [Anaeromyxobacter sp.]|nr:acyltransferase domain-containing protein [Anaeromyxobacter sp.]
MSGLAVLCPGQGGQRAGMLDLALATAAGAEVIRRASAAAGLDLAALAGAGGPDTFRNAVAQPLLCAVELATWAALRASLPRPRLLAGYSLGELAAYGCAGALEVEALASLAARRAAIMDAAAGARGGLVALRGLSPGRAEALARGAGAEVAIVNGPDHCIVGGPDAALAEVARVAARAGVKAQRLCVDVAAHTSALAAAVPPFREALSASALRDPGVPVLAGISGEPVRDRAGAIAALSRQLAERVEWGRCLAAAAELGCTAFLELGPGTALARMVAEALPGAEARSVDEFRSVEGVARWVAARLSAG